VSIDDRVVQGAYSRKDADLALSGLIATVDSASSNTIQWDNTYQGTGTSIDPVPPYYTTSMGAIPRCEHIMGDETELEDGQVIGFCVACGDKIKGRRMVGGYGLARLKDALVDALGDPNAMANLLDEIDRVELMLHVEEQALRSAYDMIEMARKMVKTIVMPEES
jgi:hypothetical protein